LAKSRLDALICARGLVPSREKARALILAGQVKVNGRVVDKAGHQIDETADINILETLKYVSRGGFKMEGAIRAFDIDFKNKTVLDVGASTGGYTDCALQNGALHVYALDVGYGQLDWTLRNNPQVTVIERTNVRYFTPDQLEGPVDIITMDVSFISTCKVFPVLGPLLRDDGKVVSLIKPQFEAGKEKVGKHGVVKDAGVHREVLQKCIQCAAQYGLGCTDVTYSPITGPQGNIEFFIYLTKGQTADPAADDKIEKVVAEAHQVLEV
jgi:23S rRNA (cytidine1920-2'-O)/16S rRNA (cytidine1409-2'-O)-methyltransferase